jgi:hypothetical protein
MATRWAINAWQPRKEEAQWGRSWHAWQRGESSLSHGGCRWTTPAGLGYGATYASSNSGVIRSLPPTNPDGGGTNFGAKRSPAVSLPHWRSDPLSYCTMAFVLQSSDSQNLGQIFSWFYISTWSTLFSKVVALGSSYNLGIAILGKYLLDHALIHAQSACSCTASLKFRT